MKRGVPLALVWVIGILAGTAALGNAPSDTMVFGQPVEVFGGIMTSYGVLDEQGRVEEAGIIVPLAVIENAPLELVHDGHAMAVDAVVEFPPAVRQQTSLDHLGLFWNPAGHEPEVRYGNPHWDFHFFDIPAAEAAAIDCSDLTQADLTLVAEGWTPAVPPGAPEADFCVPLMGFHSLPASEFTAPGQIDATPFDKVMITGYYGGDFIFVEPMVTRDLLLQRADFDLPVPRPAQIGRATRYPTTFQARYDAATDSYTMVFGDFVDLR